MQYRTLSNVATPLCLLSHSTLLIFSSASVITITHISGPLIQMYSVQLDMTKLLLRIFFFVSLPFMQRLEQQHPAFQRGHSDAEGLLLQKPD